MRNYTWNLNEIIQHLSGKLLVSSKTAAIKDVSTDTRDLEEGDIFIALSGYNHDGHNFIAQAIAKGASLIIINRGHCVAKYKNTNIVSVGCTLTALGQLAQLKRQKINPIVMAITGSCGKTTVKEMLASILRSVTPYVCVTPSNNNNEIGVPLTMLSLKPNDKYLVIELGARHPGDIKYLTQFVQPNVSLVNNVMPSHLETFGSLDKIAECKHDIYMELKPYDNAIVNLDDYYSSELLSKLPANTNIISYSLDKTTDISARSIQFNNYYTKFTLVYGPDSAEILLPTVGNHMVRNALAAASCAYANNIPLEKVVLGLNNFQSPIRRLNFKTGHNNALIIDDSYNSSPASVNAAIDTLSLSTGDTKILVLGQMLELGENSINYHKQIANQAYNSGIDQIWGTGELTKNTIDEFKGQALYFECREQLSKKLKMVLNSKVTVLIKGSNSTQMNKVVDELC